MSDDGPSVRVGDVIAGKYRVERVLGRGAMGVVVAAMHLELGELQAIKFMSAEALEEPGTIERFLREAKAASRLKSQFVVRVFDVGRLSADGRTAPYIVMEHLEGTDLRVRLKQQGPLSVDELVLYVVQACEAIGEAHAAGIVHRDIKPGNLFLTTGVGGSPVIKVFDFGIAKVAQAGSLDGGRDLTATAAVLGTPKFMSPEQMRGERNAVDARSDIWALGVTMYNLLTRKMPFGGDSIASLCSAVLYEEPVPVSTLRPGLPAGIDAVIARCLAKDPAQRFPTAAALAEALLPLGSEEIRRAAPRIVLAPPRAPLASGPDGSVSTIGSSSTLPAVRPVPLDPPSHPTAADAATGAPWAHATGAHAGPRRSGARIAAIVGLAALALGGAGFLFYPRSTKPPPAPAATAVANEAMAALASPPPRAEPSASSVAAPPPTVAPAPPVSATAAVSAAAVVSAGAPHPFVPAKPGGGSKGAHGSTDPFWSSRH